MSRALLLMVFISAGTIAGCHATPEKPAAVVPVSDASVRDEIRSRLAADVAMSRRVLSVDVWKGNVQLTGRAMSSLEKSRAEAIARSVRGVRVVANNVEVWADAEKPLQRDDRVT